MEVGRRKQGGRCGVALALHVDNPRTMLLPARKIRRSSGSPAVRVAALRALRGWADPLNPRALLRAVECAAFSRICKLRYGSLRRYICQHVTERAIHPELRCVERAIDCLGDH